MKSRLLLVAAALVVVSGCEDLDGLYAGSPTEPTAPTLSGRWTGQINATVEPFPLVPGEMQLTQSGSSVTGTVTINNARTGNITGSLSGTRFTGGWIYTDLCGGSASFSADLLQNGTNLTGSYTSSDCLGSNIGTFSFQKQP